MGAGTSRSGSAANLNDAGAFVRQQEQKAAAAREKNNIGPTRGTSSYDQRRSSNNTGIAFGPGRADRDVFNLGRGS